MAEPTTGTAQGLINRRDSLLLGIAIFSMLIVGGGFYYLQNSNSRSSTWLTLAHSLTEDVEGAVRNGESVAHGMAPELAGLSATAENIGATVRQLDSGDADIGLPPAPGEARAEVDATTTAWGQMKQTVDAVITGEPAFKRSSESAQTIVATIHSSTSPADDSGLFRDYEAVAEKLSQRGAGAGQLFLVTGQLVAIERIYALAPRVLSQGRDVKVIAGQLEAAVKSFARNNEALLGDTAVSGQAQAIREKTETLTQAAQAISANADAVDKLQQASAQLRAKSTNLIAAASALEQKLSDITNRRGLLPFVVYTAGAVALVTMSLFVFLNITGVRRRTRLAEDKEARQQQAILSLLDEITNLANGDLTVDVTVTEDFTGAIADSINYTVQTLRGLVGTINRTSEDIVGSAANTQETASRMSQASDRQTREVTSAAAAITATSDSLQDVATRAERIAVDAQASVQIAHNGAGTVGRTIQSMASLREQIQDTAKRIKRLGESSQEIGNIIEFINDIAEQTNTLALNASIQAAMAGEQGRGFAVVADEVQRLAERAGSATRQIENLVKTIQTDTNEAIISMERSTANVVSGAKSAEEAGQSLTRIEAASQELAKSIQDIALAARSQSAETTKVAGTMQSIREIAVQTSTSAERTTQAVGELNALSDKLRESVAGFKLPEGAGA